MTKLWKKPEKMKQRCNKNGKNKPKFRMNKSFTIKSFKLMNKALLSNMGKRFKKLINNIRKNHLRNFRDLNSRRKKLGNFTLR